MLLCLLPVLLKAQSSAVPDTTGYNQAKVALMLVSEKLNKGTDVTTRIALFDEMRKLIMLKNS